MITRLRLNIDEEVGRLGNKMFQIAAVIGVATKHNDTFIFPEYQYSRDFINVPTTTQEIRVDTVYKEPHFQYSEIPYTPNMAIDGYFQSERYFEHCSAEIRKAFEPSQDLLNKIHSVAPPEIISDDEYVVSVQVRRTDYLDKYKDCYHICTMEYYTKAMELFPKATKFYICTDDVSWCKKNFIGDKYIFTTTKDIPDIYLQSMCRGHIISNSTFGWWGAWLNPNNPKVVAPKQWMGPKLSHLNTDDLIPKRWETL